LDIGQSVDIFFKVLSGGFFIAIAIAIAIAIIVAVARWA
jgi:hypothetical protein